MAMKVSVHPGAIVQEDCLKPLVLSVSIEMAYRLSTAFGSTPETWLGMQLAFDLAQSRHLEQAIKVEHIVAA